MSFPNFFSRATSGRVSPSDLPDSPSQTMPTSPRRSRRKPLQQQPQLTKLSPAVRPIAAARPTPPQTITEEDNDGVRTYEEEGTPAQFSERTSLSNLTFDDEEEKQPNNVSATADFTCP